MLYLAVFIAEITARAFIIADSNKRRTLSRADIAKALSKSDQFDFLIDILPREEPFPAGAGGAAGAGGKAAKKANGVKDQVRLPESSCARGVLTNRGLIPSTHEAASKPSRARCWSTDDGRWACGRSW